MDAGEAYFPFVRFALARYQPQSVPDAHLSRVVLVDFAQLVPNRSASVTFDPIDPTSVQLAGNGLTYAGPSAPAMTATLQTQPIGSGDLAWVPVCDPTERSQIRRPRYAVDRADYALGRHAARGRSGC